MTAEVSQIIACMHIKCTHGTQGTYLISIHIPEPHTAEQIAEGPHGTSSGSLLPIATGREHTGDFLKSCMSANKQTYAQGFRNFKDACASIPGHH